MSESPDLQVSAANNRYRLIDQSFSSLSADPLVRIDELRALKRHFIATLGDFLGPAINDRVRQMPQQAPEDFRKVATFVNDLLRETELRVREPASGLPGLVIADVKSGKESQVPRYRIVVKHRADGKTTYGRIHYKPLFDLTLMPAPTRLEPFSHGFQSRRGSLEDEPERQR